MKKISKSLIAALAVSALIVGFPGCKKKETPPEDAKTSAEDAKSDLEKKTDTIKKDVETSLDKAGKKVEKGIEKAGRKIDKAGQKMEDAVLDRKK
jgi:hypothetical protein